MTMGEQDYQRLVPSIGGGATFKSQERKALSFPQDTGLSYDEAYEWVETLGWYAFTGKSAPSIYQFFATVGVPQSYIVGLRASLNLYTVDDAQVYAAFYREGVLVSYARAFRAWSANSVLRFHADHVDPGYGAMGRGRDDRYVPADVLHPHRAGAPPEFAIPLIERGLRGKQVADLWSAGVPLEYALTMT